MNNNKPYFNLFNDMGNKLYKESLKKQEKELREYTKK